MPNLPDWCYPFPSQLGGGTQPLLTTMPMPGDPAVEPPGGDEGGDCAEGDPNCGCAPDGGGGKCTASYQPSINFGGWFGPVPTPGRNVVYLLGSTNTA